MAFPGPHYLLAWNGLLPGGETFTGGVRLSPEFSLSSQEDEVSALTAYKEALRLWWISTGNRLTSNRVQLQTVKLNRIGADGLYQRNYTNRFDFVGTLPAGTSAGSHPNQIACVLTLETGASRGLAHRGRLFFPIPSAGVDQTGLLDAQTAIDAAGQGATLINNLNAVRPGARVTVYSAGSTKTGEPGTSRPVTAVSVGRVLDTMRTRRRSLLEDRRTAAVAVPPA